MIQFISLETAANWLRGVTRKLRFENKDENKIEESITLSPYMEIESISQIRDVTNRQRDIYLRIWKLLLTRREREKRRIGLEKTGRFNLPATELVN